VRHPLFGFAAGLFFVLACRAGSSQVAPAAVGPLGLSVFGGATGTYTHFNGGKNLGATLGGDLELPRVWVLRPSAEVRGTYPFKQGHWVGEKNILGGVRENVYLRALQPFHITPFGDLLFGWGRLSYPYGGRLSLDGTYRYFHTTSFVFSPGAGGELRLSSRWALRGDVQFQHYSIPVTTSGRIWSTPFTGSVVYRFDRYHTTAPWASSSER
jgi:hypothetical protein